MPCAFSTIVLDALRRTDLELVGIVTPDRSARPGGQISSPKPTIAVRHVRDARLDATPRFAVRSLRDASALPKLMATEPDLITVACFPWLIPAELVGTATLAAINVHPSLLPRWRGADPLFWTFHAGDTESGVTLHLLDAAFDTGPILDQRTVTIDAGESLPSLERRLAAIGGSLLIDLARTLPELPDLRPQDEAHATQAPIPDAAARTIDASWTVDRARRFVSGVAQSHGPLSYQRPDGSLLTVAPPGKSESRQEIALADGVLRLAVGSAAKESDRALF